MYKIAIAGASSLLGKELKDALSDSSLAAGSVTLLDDDQGLGQLDQVGDEITLQGVSFNIDDTGKLRQAARDDAVVHAKSQADQLAAATGLKVGKVVSIVEGSVPNIPLVYAASAPATSVPDAAAVPLQPGQQELNLSVTVVYELTS